MMRWKTTVRTRFYTRCQNLYVRRRKRRGNRARGFPCGSIPVPRQPASPPPIGGDSTRRGITRGRRPTFGSPGCRVIPYPAAGALGGGGFPQPAPLPVPGKGRRPRPPQRNGFQRGPWRGSGLPRRPAPAPAPRAPPAALAKL